MNIRVIRLVARECVQHDGFVYQVFAIGLEQLSGFCVGASVPGIEAAADGNAGGEILEKRVTAGHACDRGEEFGCASVIIALQKAVDLFELSASPDVPNLHRLGKLGAV